MGTITCGDKKVMNYGTIVFMRAKKSLGQHFLKSERVVNDMVNVAAVSSDNIVLEIGPGKGVLTKHLLKTGAKVIAVEKDPELVSYLHKKFSHEILSDQLNIVEEDILDFKIQDFQTRQAGFKIQEYKIVANIPYYITGGIIRDFLSTQHQPESMTLLVQKEVAERIVAQDKKESVLSMSVKAYGEPEYIRTIPAKLFDPVPKVDSAILTITNISKEHFVDISEETFFNVVKAGFAHKRKTLLNNLVHAGYSKKLMERVFKDHNLPTNIRAEQLSAKTWLDLCTIV